MAEWNKEKVHCLVTWLTLVDLDQTRRKGDTAGAAKMTSLTFFNPQDDDRLRKTKAKTLAIQFDNLFRRYWGAQYEAGIGRSQAINAMIKVLVDSEKTVAELAEKINEVYRFHGEEQ